MKKRNIFFGLALMFCFTGCYDLIKCPKGYCLRPIPLQVRGENEKLSGSIYQTGNYNMTMSAGDGMRTQGFHAWWWTIYCRADTHSDNLASAAVNSRLMGLTSLSNAVALDNYTAIRNINFLLNNLDNCVEKGSVSIII